MIKIINIDFEINSIQYLRLIMNQLFTARNVLREGSFDKFSDFIQKNKQNLKPIDFNNLLQESFYLYKNSFMNYIKLFHKYYQDIIYCKINDGKDTLTILQQILIYRKSFQLEELFTLDSRIIQDINIYSLKCILENTSKSSKQQKYGYEMIQLILKKRPDIVLDVNLDEKYNPLIQSLRNQMFEIAILLLKYNCTLLKSRNYSSNEFHYLFSSRSSKNNRNKNDNKILEITEILLQNKVDLYQKNQNGRPAFDLCPKDLKQEVQKLYKFTYSTSKNYQTNRHQNNDKYKKNNKNSHSSQYQVSKGSDSSSRYDNNNTEKPKIQNMNHHYNNSVNHSNNMISNNYHSSSSNNLTKYGYKQKVRSQFGGKDMNRESNELLRINIMSKDISNQKHHIKEQTNIVKVLNSEQLQNQASLIFQKHTKRKQQHFHKQKQEYQRQQKTQRENRSKLIQNQQLKYYLKQQIRTFSQLRMQNSFNDQKFNDLKEKITIHLKSILPIEVGLYGSYATGLHLDKSDIDLVIIPKNDCNYSSRYIFERIMQKLSEMKQIIQQTVFLDKASVPIIKATCTAEYDFKNIDISFQHQYHNGLSSVVLIKKFLQYYPELKNLILVLKNFIYESQLQAPYSGGISSYGLILMIFAFIQNEQKQNPQTNNKQRTQDDIDLRSAQLLIGFLRFYGFTMDYITQKIIIIEPDEVYSQNYQKCTLHNPDWNNQFPPQPKLVIMDPLDEDNNVGKHTRKIRQIKMAFEIAYIAIHTNQRCKNKKNCLSYKNIKSVKIQDIRFKQNKRPCCVLKRMFESTNNFKLTMY